jgi:phenylacetate-coenzyme A ligase PaaK-like adenylate-forming protein
MGDYETTRQQQVALFQSLMPKHLERLGWDRVRIDEHQTSALRELLATAQAKSPWHARRLSGTDTTSITGADLRSLPTMTKSDLMSYWDDIVTDQRLRLADVDRHLNTITTDAYIFDRYHAFASGGSSGVRGVFAWDWEAWATTYAITVRQQVKRAIDSGTFSGAPVTAVVAAEAPTHMTSAMGQTFSDPSRPIHRLPVTMPIADIVGALNRIGTLDQLVGYPSMLFELAHEARAGQLRIAPKAVMGTSEPLLPEIRAAIEDAWQCPVGSVWGTSEGGLTGVPCLHGAGMHLPEDALIIEPVNADDTPTEPGELSAKVLLTNLINPLLPLIRYEISDEVRVLVEPCPCGSAYARVDDILGRTDHVFHYDSGASIHPHVFRSPLSREPRIIEYQVRQTVRGAEIDVRVSERVDAARIASSVREHLLAAGLADPEIVVREVPSIARSGAGKLARFVPK